MEQYISKAAILRRLDRELESISNDSTNFALGRKMELANILSFLSTLEVKEVDLEKEIDEHWDEWAKEDGFHSIDFARHFYELGLKSKGE